MKFIQTLRDRASQYNKHIVFPEAEDPRVLAAAEWLDKESVCRVSLLGSPDDIHSLANEHGVELGDSVALRDPAEHEDLEHYARFLHDKRKEKGLTSDNARELVKHPLYFAAAMVALEEADGAVAGSIATTGDVLRAAIQVIGVREGNSIVSSIFLMALPGGRVLTYGDCGVVPYPDEAQLADIAIESARSHRLLTEQKPVVAMLSFSTKGSADHDRVELVQRALRIAQQKEQELLIDGEFQFDAAFVPEVARRKAADSAVAGKANVFIFPNLDAGNISYKITERLGGASATGPIVQGLARPMMDLSRGCGWGDIVNEACVAILMGEG